MTFGGVRALLVAVLDDQLGIRTVTRRPANLATVLPLNQVVTIGGGSHDDDSDLKSPRVDIGSFAADEAAAEAQAYDVEDVIRKILPGMTVGGCVITKTTTGSAPSWRPYDDPAIFYFGGAYQIFLKVT